MARLGLGDGWKCAFANDIDRQKAACYRANFKDAPELKVADVASLSVSDLLGHVDLAWASFPCQDLSLAGNGQGLRGKRSGLFWEFWRLVKGLRSEGRAPRLIVLENVYGAITSHKGKDLAAICEAFAAEEYRFAPMVLDAADFLPQSRPRLFIVAFQKEAPPPQELICPAPRLPWHPEAFGIPYDLLGDNARRAWIWLELPRPHGRPPKLADMIEHEPGGVAWHSEFETRRLLSMMSPINIQKVKAAERMGRRIIGTVYKRTRPDGTGARLQRAEVRFDDVAGCLRTPSGGSSRQIILVVDGRTVRSRLLSPREAARLMGIPESYTLPERYNDAYHLAGDGVAVPVVKHLRVNLLEPALRKAGRHTQSAA